MSQVGIIRATTGPSYLCLPLLLSVSGQAALCLAASAAVPVLTCQQGASCLHAQQPTCRQPIQACHAPMSMRRRSAHV